VGVVQRPRGCEAGLEVEGERIEIDEVVEHRIENVEVRQVAPGHRLYRAGVERNGDPQRPASARRLRSDWLRQQRDTGGGHCACQDRAAINARGIGLRLGDHIVLPALFICAHATRRAAKMDRRDSGICAVMKPHASACAWPC
jgi:hypothetical protein